jgi:hypothetical protein
MPSFRLVCESGGQILYQYGEPLNGLLIGLVAAQHEPRQYLSNLSCNLFGKLEPLLAGHQLGGVDSECRRDPLDPANRQAPIILFQLLNLLA